MTTVTVEEIATRYNLIRTQESGGVVYIGANFIEPGAENTRFHLFGDGEFKGMAVDHKIGKRYTSYEVAQAAGIAYEAYEAFESHPHNNAQHGAHNNAQHNAHQNNAHQNGTAPSQAPGQAPSQAQVVRHDLKVPEGKYDNRSLEERGLTIDAARFFQIGKASGDKWGESRPYPTFHPDGRPGQGRRKWRYPQYQLTTHPSKPPAKVTCEANQRSLGTPVGYGINHIELSDVVWLVNSELAVWLFWQEGIRAVCPLGEARSERSYAALVEAVSRKGAAELRVLLDNDVAGHTGAVRARKAALNLELPVVVHDLATAPKLGFDASDLYEFWKENQADTVTFGDLLRQQAVASLPVLKIWEAGLKAGESAAVVNKAVTGLGEVGRVIERERTGERRQCPKCERFTVIEDMYKGGWLCFKKIDGCGAHFDENDSEIMESSVKAPVDDGALTLLNMLRAYQLFHTDDGSCCIVINQDGQKKTYDIVSTAFARWVRVRYQLDTGKIPKAEMLKNTLEQLAALAFEFGPEIKTAVRSGMHNGRIYIDLCNDAGECIEIDTEGWRVVGSCELFFRRDHTMLPLPHPKRPDDGDNAQTWEDFKQLLNYGTEENWILIVAWMVAALRPDSECPIFNLFGAMGSGKTMITKLVRQTLDPSSIPVIPILIDARETLISAEKQRIFALDNQESMEKWASNLIAAMVTGSGMAFRKLFTDDDRKVFTAQPAFMVSGIPEKMGGIDLSDRMLKLFIPSLDDREEGYIDKEEIVEAWEPLRPYLLAAVCDAMSAGLRYSKQAKEKLRGLRLPRMANFAKWVLCCMDELPFTSEDFLRTYRQNAEDSAGADLESFFPQVFMEWFAQMGGKYEGLASELYELLWDVAVMHNIDAERLEQIRHSQWSDIQKDIEISKLRKEVEGGLRRMGHFPANPGALGTWLTKIKPSLLKAGKIDCQRVKRMTGGVLWLIERVGPERGPAAVPAPVKDAPAPALPLDLPEDAATAGTEDADDSVFDDEPDETGNAYGKD